MNRTMETIQAGPARIEGSLIGLYAATVILWGVSWIALNMQLGVVAPEMSVFWRFLFATILMWAWVMSRRAPMRFRPLDHLRFMGVGLCLFSCNFICFYYGGLTVTSGLEAVVFSLASIFNLLIGAVVLRQRIEARVALGGLVGALGIALLFWPEITEAGAKAGALKGLGLCTLGTLFFCSGNMISALVQRRGIPLMSANAWGMTYGTGLLLVINLIRGNTFTMEFTPAYLGGIAYLVIGASVMAFFSYLTLLRRLGPARAGYATVLFPLVALSVSTAFEGYVWTLPAMAGVVLALAGNILVLTRPART